MTFSPGLIMKRLSSALLAFFLLLILPAAASAESWAVYWYICGSDLETRTKAATEDIREMLAAKLPKDVTVVIQTGGARNWHMQGISAGHIGRYVFRDGAMTQVEKLPQASMGKSSTLESFLAFCREKYPADRKVFVFWDHGNGSVAGLANDENFDFEALSLPDIRRAFSKVYQPSDDKPPFEVIGFDTCLMATVDTANAIKGFTKYMVASQDLEPGNGWYYTGWLGALGKKTSMNGAELGKIMCDSYMKGCRDKGTEGNATLSVVDMAKLDMLNMTYNAFGLEAVSVAVDDTGFYATLGRQAKASENYMNSRSEGFTNMVDLGSLARRMQQTLPDFTGSLLEALNDAVIYKVNGPYRKSSGLSCYYPFDGSEQSFRAMMNVGNITSFLILNGLQFGFIDSDVAVKHLERISNEISAAVDADSGSSASSGTSGGSGGGSAPAVPSSPSDEGGSGESGGGSGSSGSSGGFQTSEGTVTGGGSGSVPGISSFISSHSPGGSAGLSSIIGQGANAAFGSVAPLAKPDISELEDFKVTITESDGAELNLGPERIKFLDSVRFYLAFVSPENDLILLLGKDADMKADWETGVFRDNFRGVWPTLDGHLVYMEVTNEAEDVNHYVVPIKLNGERCNLFVIYDFPKQAYRVLGARRVIGNNIADKGLIHLKAGDKVTTILKSMSISGEDDDFREVDVDTFTLGENVKFEETDMGDGSFMFLFEMTDVQNNTATSEIVSIEVKDGTATYSTGEEEEDSGGDSGEEGENGSGSEG